jgi:hypothetical protein
MKYAKAAAALHVAAEMTSNTCDAYPMCSLSSRLGELAVTKKDPTSKWHDGQWQPPPLDTAFTHLADQGSTISHGVDSTSHNSLRKRHTKQQQQQGQKGLLCMVVRFARVSSVSLEN